MKKFWILLLNLIIILIVICNYRVVQTVVDPSVGTVSENVDTELVDINITYEKDLGGSAVVEVKKAIQKLPGEVVKDFSNKGWKIVVVSTVDLTGTEFEGITTPLTVGLTNYDAKTIQISPCEDKLNNYIYIRTLHEMSHFADEFYGNASDTEEWISLYEENKDKYVEFEFNGISKTKNNASDLEYATSNRWEFFASTMKDYLYQPEYLKQNYPEVYSYLNHLILGV